MAVNFFTSGKILFKTTCVYLPFQSVEMNPDLAHGLRGTLSTDRRMVRVCDLGGTVESPVPSLKDIKKSYAIW